MTADKRFTIHGPTGQPVKPGDHSLWLTLDGQPYELPALVAVNLGNALVIAGSRATSGTGLERVGHTLGPGVAVSYAEGAYIDTEPDS